MRAIGRPGGGIEGRRGSRIDPERGGRYLGIPQNPAQPARQPVTINPVSIKPGAVQMYRKGRILSPYDLVTPTRASKNIGLFGVVMPWQTEVILTREIAIWQISQMSKRIDRWLLLALLSLKVVHAQFKCLVLMQMNREDLGNRYRELLLPLPREGELRERWSRPIRDYFESMTAARKSYDDLATRLDPVLFADRP